MRKLLHNIWLYVFVLMIILLDSKLNAQCPPNPAYITLNDNFTVTGWTPTCRNGGNGFIRFTNATGGNPPRILRVRDLMFNIVETLNIGSGTMGDVTGLMPGTYIADVLDACGEDSADKIVTIINPVGTLEYFLPASGYWDEYTDAICGDIYLHRLMAFASRTGQTLRFLYVNHFNDTLINDIFNTTIASGAVQEFISFMEIPKDFFDGMPVQASVISLDCPDYTSISTNILYFENFMMTTQTLNQITPGFEFSSPDLNDPCSQAYRIHRLRRFGTNPIIAVIEEETMPGSGIWIPGTDVFNNVLGNFNGNVPFQRGYPVNNLTTEGELIFSGLAYDRNYRITYTDACGDVFQESFNQSIPNPSTGRIECVVSGSLSEAHHLESGGSLRANVVPQSGFNVSPYTFKIIGVNMANWTSSFLNLDGMSFDFVDFENNPLEFTTNNIIEDVFNLNLPEATYTFAYEDACGNNDTMDWTINCKSEPQINIQVDRCNYLSGNADITFRVNFIPRPQQYRAALYDGNGDLVTIGINVGSNPNEMKQFLEVPAGLYELRFGGIRNDGAMVNFPAFDPPLPRLDGGYIYKMDILLEPLEELDVEYFAFYDCEDHSMYISSQATGGIVPYSYRILDMDFNQVVPSQNVGFFGGLLLENYLIEVTDSCGRTRIRPITQSNNPILINGKLNPVCEGDNVILSSQLDLDNITYIWSGPGGFNETGAEVFIPNVNPNNAGIYVLTLMIEDPSICTEEFMIELLVEAKPEILNEDLILCDTQGSVLLEADSVGGIWTINGMTLENPEFDPMLLGFGEYEIIYTIQSMNCFLSDTIQINVINGPEVLNASLTECEKEGGLGVAMFDLSGAISEILNGQQEDEWDLSFHMSFKDAQCNESPIEPILISESDTLYVRISEVGGTCYATTELELLVIPSDIELEIEGLRDICIDEVTNINGVITGGVEPFTVEWIIGDMSMGSGHFSHSSELNITLTGIMPGLTDIIFSVTDMYGCGDSIMRTIRILSYCQSEIILADPCNCEHPENIFDGRVISLFYEELEISVSGALPEVSIQVTEVVSGFRNMDGILYTANTILGITDADGNLQTVFPFYRLPGEQLSIEIEGTEFISEGCIADTCAVLPIPCMGFWSLLILGLLIMVISVVTLKINKVILLD
ncbi:MAG TPA: immunoglobulin domain-containing protein [Saprospiraceae bacterium]|nr:immunoglobulin domain-containing protein [Saprospiraceae bacterium]